MNDTERNLDTALYAPAFEQINQDFKLDGPSTGKPDHGSVHARLDKDEISGDMHLTVWAYAPTIGLTAGSRLFVIRVPYK